MKHSLFSGPISRIGKLILAEVGNKPVTLIVLMCGMVVTYLQYQAFLESGRVEQSYKLVEEWETRGYDQDLQAFSARVVALEMEGRDVFGAEIDMQKEPGLNFVVNGLGDPDAETAAAIDRLYYFFDKMSLCVEQDLCDRALLVEYFGTAVNSFWGYTVSYRSDKRDRSPSFGSFTERFSNSLPRP
ncbi:MAG: hypothetical protein AAF718_13590 [Pseudomonadota bacterium]